MIAALTMAWDLTGQTTSASYKQAVLAFLDDGNGINPTRLLMLELAFEIRIMREPFSTLVDAWPRKRSRSDTAPMTPRAIRAA